MKFPNRRFGLTAVATTLVALPLGCATVNQKDMLHFLRDREHQVSAIEYRVGVPDAIQINAPRVEEIDGTQHRIQPNGKISLKLLGDVKIVGMTAKEIGAKLEVLLSRYYVDPKVNVKVVDYRSKKYYVYGEGIGAGARPYTGKDTLLDAVFQAVPNYLSESDRVSVIRPARDDRPVRKITIDVDKMLKTGDWSKNILLEPDDIVYVPPTPAAWFAKQVHKLLYPVAPAVALYATPAYVGNVNDVYKKDSHQTYTIGNVSGGGY